MCFCLWNERVPHLTQSVWDLVCLLPKAWVPFVCFGTWCEVLVRCVVLGGGNVENGELARSGLGKAGRAGQLVVQKRREKARGEAIGPNPESFQQFQQPANRSKQSMWFPSRPNKTLSSHEVQSSPVKRASPRIPSRGPPHAAAANSPEPPQEVLPILHSPIIGFVCLNSHHCDRRKVVK